MVKAVDKHYHWWCLYMIVQSEVNTGKKGVCCNNGADIYQILEESSK